MRKRFIKIFEIIIITVQVVIVTAIPSFAMWAKTDRGGIYWISSDGTFPKDGWRLIDEDGDGKGYYYYFNENGFLQIDDITPDYKIVDKEGRRLDINGNPEIGTIEVYRGEYFTDIYSEEILAEIEANKNVYDGSRGVTSSGQVIVDIRSDEDDGPRPSDNIILNANADGSASVLLGPGVTLRDKNESKYDTTIDKAMVNYVISSDKFSKKVNGTTFTKNKWKEVMALKGTGATVVFENPKHNFNRLRGRIATHYFTYTDRETICKLNIINNDDNEEIYTTSAFNYNSGCKFDCTFFQSVSSIRFELEVSGQYTSRVCYLRDCEFSFDRETWEEEQYAKEIEEEYIRKYGTPSDADYEDEVDELGLLEEMMGDIPTEGESPYDRYRRLHGLATASNLPFDYDEEDDSVTAAMRASISELRRQMELEDEKRNKVSGPAFDEKLKNRKAPVGPNGTTNIIEALEDGGTTD